MTVKYTEEHEWIQLEDHEAAVAGITLHAQDAFCLLYTSDAADE